MVYSERILSPNENPFSDFNFCKKKSLMSMGCNFLRVSTTNHYTVKHTWTNLQQMILAIWTLICFWSESHCEQYGSLSKHALYRWFRSVALTRPKELAWIIINHHESVTSMSLMHFSFQRHGQNDSVFFTNTTDSGGPGIGAVRSHRYRAADEIWEAQTSVQFQPWVHSGFLHF